jgi:hypothetical protein
MSRYKDNGEKTSTKADRKHDKLVAEAIRKHGNAAVSADATSMTPDLIRRWDSTWKHMARSHAKYSRKRGWTS